MDELKDRGWPDQGVHCKHTIVRTYPDSEGGIGIIDIATDASEPEVTAIDKLLGRVHLEHLAHVAHLGLALLVGEVH